VLLRRLRFADLRAAGVVKNRATLGNWIRERGFPPGQLTGPNSRTWSEAEVEAYLASRPVDPKPVRVPLPPKRRRKRRAERRSMQLMHRASRGLARRRQISS
jgi:predicted DNA-binding transcriptional regulator AlpA